MYINLGTMWQTKLLLLLSYPEIQNLVYQKTVLKLRANLNEVCGANCVASSKNKKASIS